MFDEKIHIPHFNLKKFLFSGSRVKKLLSPFVCLVIQWSRCQEA